MVLAHPLHTGDLDRVLVRRAQAGDREAFAELMRTHGDAVRQLVRRFVRNSDDARDVEQDAWLRAATHLDSLRDQGRFRPWLRSIARNASLTFLSSRSQSARDTSFDECDAEAFEDPAAETPERYVLSRDSQRKVWEALGALSERDRTALFLREYQEQPYEEIAKRLGVSRNAAEVCVFRARERFRRIFLDVEEREAPCGFDAFRLSSMVERDVPAEVRREVELHLASCEPCTERLTTMTAGQALYRNLGMFGFPIPGAMGFVGRITDLIARIAGLFGGGTAGGAGASTAAGATVTTASAAAVVGTVGTASAITSVAAASAIALGVVFSQAMPPPAVQPLPASPPVAVGGDPSSGALLPVARSASLAPERGVAADAPSDVPGPSPSDAAPVAPASASLAPPALAAPSLAPVTPPALVPPSPHLAAVPPAPATSQQASSATGAGVEESLPGDDSIDGLGSDGDNLNDGDEDANRGNGNGGNANRGNGNGNGNGGNANRGNGNGNGGDGNGGHGNSANASNANSASAANGNSGNNGNGNNGAKPGNANTGGTSNAHTNSASAANGNGNGNGGANNGNANGGANNGNANGGANNGNANGGANNGNANGNGSANIANVNGPNGGASNAHANSGNGNNAGPDVPRGNAKDSLVLETPRAAGPGVAAVAGALVPGGSGQAQAASEDKGPPVGLPGQGVKESQGQPTVGPPQSQPGGGNAGLTVQVTGNGGRDARSSGPGASERRNAPRGK